MKKLILPEIVLRIDNFALKGCTAEIFFRGESVLIQDGTILRKDKKNVIWEFSDGKGTVNLDMNRLMDTDGIQGMKLRAYDMQTCDWNQQKLMCGAQYITTVRRPFCCRVGDSFWVAYGDNQFVKARLMSIITFDSISAQVRVVVLNIVSLWEFVRPVPEDKKQYLQNTHCYDVEYFRGDLEIPFCRRISAKMIEVYNIWDGGDFQFSDYIYTDDDGIDHFVIEKYDGEVFVADNVLGYHKHFPYPVKSKNACK